jgi:nucleotide-binding universal stress UspA family protein
MDSIVVGVDRTAASASALDWVAARCARRSTSVTIVNVVSRWGVGRDASDELLADAADALRARVPGQPVQGLGAEGRSAHALTALAEGADLLVIGIDPDHPVRAALGGWLPLRVAARSAVPVCIVPAGWVEGDGHITVGLADDGSSSEAVVFAAEEALARGVRLHVVHMWRDAEMASDGPAALVTDARSVIDDRRRFLDHEVRRLLARFPDLDVQSDLVRASPEAALVQGAARSELIVIGTHHSGVLAGTFSGSIAQDILWRTRCPVCIVPPRRAA